MRTMNFADVTGICYTSTTQNSGLVSWNLTIGTKYGELTDQGIGVNC